MGSSNICLPEIYDCVWSQIIGQIFSAHSKSALQIEVSLFFAYVVLIRRRSKTVPLLQFE